jgi:hypothetical protein
MTTRSKRPSLGVLVVALTTMLVSVTAHAQGNPPQSCPADPVAAMNTLQQQVDTLHLQVRTDVKNAAVDLKATAALNDPGALSLRIAYWEETLFQWETQAQLLYEQVREINRCAFRSGKYVIWVSVEQVTQVWTKTYLKVIKLTVTWFKKFYRYKLLGIINTSTVGCCECNGVPNPPITNCASAPGLTQAQCAIACLPFGSNGMWHFQQMCDAASGTCVPDP